MKELKKALNGTVVAITKENELVLDNGVVIDFHPYETYILERDVGELSRMSEKELKYYQPSFFGV